MLPKLVNIVVWKIKYFKLKNSFSFSSSNNQEFPILYDFLFKVSATVNSFFKTWRESLVEVTMQNFKLLFLTETNI